MFRYNTQQNVRLCRFFYLSLQALIRITHAEKNKAVHAVTDIGFSAADQWGAIATLYRLH